MKFTWDSPCIETQCGMLPTNLSSIETHFGMNQLPLKHVLAWINQSWFIMVLKTNSQSESQEEEQKFLCDFYQKNISLTPKSYHSSHENQLVLAWKQKPAAVPGNTSIIIYTQHLYVKSNWLLIQSSMLHACKHISYCWYLIYCLPNINRPQFFQLWPSILSFILGYCHQVKYENAHFTGPYNDFLF